MKRKLAGMIGRGFGGVRIHDAEPIRGRPAVALSAFGRGQGSVYITDADLVELARAVMDEAQGKGVSRG
jgi:hypothetical protein